MQALILTFLLAASLGAAGPSEDAYSRAVENLGVAIDAVGEVDSKAASAALKLAIAAVLSHPVALRGDPSTLEQITRARLHLVWCYLDLDDQVAANAAMDSAIRSMAGTALPMNEPGLGTVLRPVYDERLRALQAAGTATIDVDCKVRCEVLVEGHRSPNPTNPLFLGDYQIWILARDGSVAPQRYAVSLEQPGQVVSLVFEEGAEGEGSTDGPAITAPSASGRDEPRQRDSKRMLPRWAEALTMVAGVGVLAAGAALTAIDGKCTGGGDIYTCLRVWENQPQGYALIGLGAALVITSGVMLTIDEVRVGNEKHRQAMLTWTFRF